MQKLIISMDIYLLEIVFEQKVRFESDVQHLPSSKKKDFLWAFVSSI